MSRELPFFVRRLAEDGESGKIFADWLRSKLVATGELRESVGNVADLAVPIYVIRKDAVHDIARGESRAAFYIRDILANRDEGCAALSYCKTDLCDDNGNLAIVRHADYAVLMPWWVVCNATLAFKEVISLLISLRSTLEKSTLITPSTTSIPLPIFTIP